VSCAKPRQAQRTQYSNSGAARPDDYAPPFQDRAGARFGDQQLTDYSYPRLSPFGLPAMPRDRPAKSLIEE
jgi:hypothetical protein